MLICFIISRGLIEAASIDPYPWQATSDLKLSLMERNLLHDHHLKYGAPSPARAEIKREVQTKVTWRY